MFNVRLSVYSNTLSSMISTSEHTASLDRELSDPAVNVSLVDTAV